MTPEYWMWIESCRTKWLNDGYVYHWRFTDMEGEWLVEVMTSTGAEGGDRVVGDSLSLDTTHITLIEAAKAAYADAFPGEELPEMKPKGLMLTDKYVVKKEGF